MVGGQDSAPNKTVSIVIGQAFGPWSLFGPRSVQVVPGGCVRKRRRRKPHVTSLSGVDRGICDVVLRVDYGRG